MGLPGKLKDLVNAKVRELRDSGADVDEAQRVAWRHAQLAGWYETIDGWKQIASDLRDKIAVRKATKQPDGKYLIQDVDVFYPNAVKSRGGRAIIYGVEDVRQIIRNTQRGVEAGNTVTLTPGHIRPEHAYTGVQLPSLGKAINFRESPRGDGWARCDLVDVEPDTYADWRRGRITGLSAGINPDAAGLNTRFGHIAALGGEPQALSRLPRTEIYAAEEIVSYADQVCFSADSAAIHGEPAMKKLNQKLASLYAAVGAAYSAMEAGEPDAENKLVEAHTNFCAGMKEFGADGGELPIAPEAAAPGAAIEAKPEEDPESGQPAFAALEGINFAADPEGAFNALLGIVKPAIGRINTLTKENATLRRQTAREQFATQIEKLKSDGHNFDADSVMVMFESCAGNPTAITALQNFVKAAPKVTPSGERSLAGHADIFAAENDDGSTPIAGRPFGAEKKHGIQRTPQQRARDLKQSVGVISYDDNDGSDANFSAAIAIGDAVSDMAGIPQR